MSMAAGVGGRLCGCPCTCEVTALSMAMAVALDRMSRPASERVKHTPQGRACCEVANGSVMHRCLLELGSGQVPVSHLWQSSGHAEAGSRAAKHDLAGEPNVSVSHGVQNTGGCPLQSVRPGPVDPAPHPRR